jgi:phage terminase large subunit
MENQKNPIALFMETYRDDPVGFARNMLNVEPLPWQQEVMEAIASGQRLVATKSGHGVGKSHCASVLMLWFLLTRIDVKIVVTAPTIAQLQDALAAEVKKWHGMLPAALRDLITVKQERLELTASPERGFISFRVARAESPTALQGVHAPPHGGVMLVIDEASGVPISVWEASLGSLSTPNSCCLLFGNPVYSSGFFYDVFHSSKKGWKLMTVSCLDNPLVSQSFIEEMRSKYPESSNQWRVRVIGEFPSQDDDTVFSAERVTDAIDREVVIPDDYPIVMGVDPARYGSDHSVVTLRQGRRVLGIYSYQKLDLVELAGRVLDIYEGCIPECAEVLVDNIGVGAGCLDILRSWGVPARGVNVSESPALGEVYANLRAELYFKAKDWFDDEVSIPDEEGLLRDLLAIRYVYRPNGKIAVERKEELSKRIGASPDYGDSFSLTFAQSSVLPDGRYRARGGYAQPFVGNVV